MEAIFYETKKKIIKERFAELKARRKREEKITLNKTTSNLFRHRQQSGVRLDMSLFNQAIVISPHERTISVEGMMTYEDLVKKTLHHGYMPAVVPQLKTITIGGAVSGGGIESSSFRGGFVHETIQEMEILTGRGDIETCSRNENSN